jgi:hypothetical protein
MTTHPGRAVRSSALLLALTLMATTMASCDDGPPDGPVVATPPEWTTDRTSAANELTARLTGLPAPGGVVVRLAFGPEADLDLYVTGPLQETVYYANTPSKIGGELAEDLRCEHPGTRIEEIRFPVVPGRYRVGVDYPRACGETRTPAPFSLTLDTPAGREEHRAIAVYHVFDPVVLEFDVLDDGNNKAPTDPEDGR